MNLRAEAIITMYRQMINDENPLTINDLANILHYDHERRDKMAFGLVVYELIKLKGDSRTNLQLNWIDIRDDPIELTEKGKADAEKLVKFVDSPYFNPARKKNTV